MPCSKALDLTQLGRADCARLHIGDRDFTLTQHLLGQHRTTVHRRDYREHAYPTTTGSLGLVALQIQQEQPHTHHSKPNGHQ